MSDDLAFFGNEKFYDFGHRFSEAGLQDVLISMQSQGGNDLYLIGGKQLKAKVHSKIITVTERKIGINDAFDLVSLIYGDNARTMLGGGDLINMSYEFKRPSLENRNKNIRYRFRLNVVSTDINGVSSLRMTFRTVPIFIPKLSGMGVPGEITQCFKLSTGGLILIVGATGSGKSTLLASEIQDMMEEEESGVILSTVEAPIEFVYDNSDIKDAVYTQMEVGRHIKSFSEGVSNCMRMAQTHILVGEAKDKDTIDRAIEAGVTGHVVMATLHASSVKETIPRMISVFEPEFQVEKQSQIVSSIRMIVVQKLVPSLDGKRVPIREYLVFTQKMRDEMLVSKDPNGLIVKFLNEHGKTMKCDLDEKLGLGLISKEVYDKHTYND